MPDSPLLVPIAVYIDSNALIGAGVSLSAAWVDRLSVWATGLGIEACVPKLCVDEWANHLVTQTRQPDAPRTFSETVGFLERQLAQRGWHTIPMLSADTNELAREALMRVAPFQDRDRGFRDAIIIESILADADMRMQRTPRITSEPFILVVSTDKPFRAGLNIRCTRFHDRLDATDPYRSTPERRRR